MSYSTNSTCFVPLARNRSICLIAANLFHLPGRGALVPLVTNDFNPSVWTVVNLFHLSLITSFHLSDLFILRLIIIIIIQFSYRDPFSIRTRLLEFRFKIIIQEKKMFSFAESWDEISRAIPSILDTHIIFISRRGNDTSACCKAAISSGRDVWRKKGAREEKQPGYGLRRRLHWLQPAKIAFPPSWWKIFRKHLRKRGSTEKFHHYPVRREKRGYGCIDSIRTRQMRV